MDRDAYAKLQNWKSSSYRKPLVLQGARQVGKTYLLQQFGEREYQNVIYLNFEETPELKDFFDRSLDPHKILDALSLYFHVTIKPTSTLIIFDEIQESNRALNSLKYFYEQAPEYHVAAAGSLMGILFSSPGSFPVGKVNFLKIYPLTFLEFLSAVGKRDWREYLENIRELTPLPAPLHQELIDLLKVYYLVGGMPEVVKRYVATGDFDEVQKLQGDIINSYILDFAKHATPTVVQKLILIWNQIPAQLAKENKKFIFSAVRKSARGREYESALQWLENAGLILRAFNVSVPKIPLAAYKLPNAFKVYALDVGLLAYMSRMVPATLLAKNRLFTEFKGALTENFVAQQLRAMQPADLFYWKNPSGKTEIDFLVETGSEVIPLEVKAGVNPKSKSLQAYRQKFQPSVVARASLLNLGKHGLVHNYPLYALHLLPSLK